MYTSYTSFDKMIPQKNTERIIRFVITISMAVVMATAKPTIPYSVLPSSSISPSTTDTSSPKTTDVTRNCTYVKNTGEIFSCLLEGFVSDPILISVGIILLVLTLFIISKIVCSSTRRNWWKSDKKKKEEALVML
ncbi:uncharacterized protein [Argopecten irradians]|uniref:uncharacterized protein isoform X2 n=1 Tax=Argopecten irradians TaxID=31199 RepID=UPI0037142EC5